MRFLSDADLATLRPAEAATAPLPLPTQVVSNGEYTPLPRSESQRRVEARIEDHAASLAPRHGMTRREFLASSAGHGGRVPGDERGLRAGVLGEPRRGRDSRPAPTQRSRAFASQFIVDCQTHFVRDDYGQQHADRWRRSFAKEHWNPALAGAESLTRFKFQNFVKEIFLDSDTKVALISGTPTDDAELMFLSNDQIAAARDLINRIAGSRRALGHGIVTPGAPGWLDEVDRVLATLRPQSLKGYTIGDPLYQTKKKSNWRLDDEKNVYPLYEKMLKAGVNDALHPQGPDARRLPHELAGHVAVRDDLGRGQGGARLAADQLRHLSLGDAAVHRVARPGARASSRPPVASTGYRTSPTSRRSFGVDNVYGELGTCFANTCVTHPKLAAALLGTLVRGTGCRPRHLGHRLRVVGIAAVADRGIATPRDPRGHAEGARLRAARRGGRPGEDRDLRAAMRRASTGSMPRPQVWRCPPTGSMRCAPSTSRTAGCEATFATATWRLETDADVPRPALVLIPGLLCDELVWQHQVRHFAGSHDVIVPMLDGFDSIPAMAASVLALAPGRFSLAGHSLGGRIALEVVRQDAARVEALALLDTGVHPCTPGEPARRQELLALACTRGMDAVAREWLPPMVHPDRRADRGFMAPLEAMVERRTPATFRNQVTALLERPDAAPVLAGDPLSHAGALRSRGRLEPARAARGHGGGNRGLRAHDRGRLRTHGAGRTSRGNHARAAAVARRRAWRSVTALRPSTHPVPSR